MTDFIAIAREALAKLEKQFPRAIYGGRKGIVGASLDGCGRAIAFRRKGDAIRVEQWPINGFGTPIILGTLPPDLASRAAAILDRIPA